MNLNLSHAFMPLLALMFIYLKLTGVILWSWWWVLAPIWIPLVVALLLAVFLVWLNWSKL
jgi:hypothetical protein